MMYSIVFLLNFQRKLVMSDDQHKMLKNPTSLRDLAMQAAIKSYHHDWSAMPKLPKCLHDEMMLKWLRCDEDFMHDPQKNVYLRKVFTS